MHEIHVQYLQHNIFCLTIYTIQYVAVTRDSRYGMVKTKSHSQEM